METARTGVRFAGAEEPGDDCHRIQETDLSGILMAIRSPTRSTRWSASPSRAFSASSSRTRFRAAMPDSAAARCSPSISASRASSRSRSASSPRTLPAAAPTSRRSDPNLACALRARPSAASQAASAALWASFAAASAFSTLPSARAPQRPPGRPWRPPRVPPGPPRGLRDCRLRHGVVRLRHPRRGLVGGAAVVQQHLHAAPQVRLQGALYVLVRRA